MTAEKRNQNYVLKTDYSPSQKNKAVKSQNKKNFRSDYSEIEPQRAQRTQSFFFCRHPGESRGPESYEPAVDRALDSGFRRNDENFFSTFSAVKNFSLLDRATSTIRDLAKNHKCEML